MSDNLTAKVDSYLKDVGAIGYNGDGKGWTRLALTPEEDAIHDYARRVYDALGWKTSTDAFGNLYCRAQDNGRRRVLLGTHLDTVTQGGNFDGVVGFIVGVESARAAIGEGAMCAIDLAVFRAEESTRFTKSCLGSSAAFGLLGAAKLNEAVYRDPGGVQQTLHNILVTRGTDVARIGTILCDPRQFSGYFETHIEQAKVLEPSGSLGIVTSIRAPERRDCAVHGAQALQAACRMILCVEKTAQLHDLLGDIVATVGKVDDFFKGADKVNAVPGNVVFGLASLSKHQEDLVRNIAASRRIAAEVSRNGRGVRLQLAGVTDHSGGTPIGLAHRRDALTAACEIILAIPDACLFPCPTVRFYMDVRSNDSNFRFRVIANILEHCQAIAKHHDVTFTTDIKEQTEPVTNLDPALQMLLRRSADELGLQTVRLPSGAGHDAMMAAMAGIPTAMLFVPSRDGLSHNPDEFTATSHICDAIRVQTKALQMFQA